MSGIAGRLLNVYGVGYEKMTILSDQEVFRVATLSKQFAVKPYILECTLEEHYSISEKRMTIQQNIFKREVKNFLASINCLDHFEALKKANISGPFSMDIVCPGNNQTFFVFKSKVIPNVAAGLKIINPKRLAIATTITVAVLALAANWVSGLFSSKTPAPASK